MNCALWLNKRKIRHASEISENIDIAALRGYYLAGSLEKWLCENGGEEYAEKLSLISPNDERLNEKLAEVFGGSTCAKQIALPSSVDEKQKNNAYTQVVLPSSGSFAFANYGIGSSAYLSLASFGEFWKTIQMIQTRSFGSFTAGSYSQWEWLFALFKNGFGSFVSSSFASFHEWEWEWLYRLFGGFGSFYASSFSSFGFELINGLFGSLSPFADPFRLPVLDEYDRIMLETLMKCPLDRFGYGIHNI